MNFKLNFRLVIMHSIIIVFILSVHKKLNHILYAHKRTGTRHHQTQSARAYKDILGSYMCTR